MYRQEKLKGVQFKIITISHLFSFSNENLITILLGFFILQTSSIWLSVPLCEQQ